MTQEDQDIELDPNKRLKFGMTREELEKVKREARQKKKLAKTWKPDH